VKALTVAQPYASLIAANRKSVETRSWQTSYRGPLAIHAAKTAPASLTREVAKASEDLILVRGAIVCVAQLVAITIAGQPDLAGELYEPEPREGILGDFTPGRYLWHLSEVEPVVPAIVCPGQRNLWDVSASDLDRLLGAAL